MKFRHYWTLVLLTCISTWTLGVVQASLLVYEDAAYAPTTSIAGLNGGTGWSGGWMANNNVVAGGLAYPGLIVRGNRITTDGNNTGSFRTFATAGLGTLTTADGKFGKEGTTLWFSFLMQRNSTTAANTFAGLSVWNGGTRQAFFGVLRDRAFWGASIDALGANGSFNTALRVTNNATVLQVIKFSFGVVGNLDRVDVFLNPVAGVEPKVPDLTAGGFDLKFDRLLINSGDTATVASFDEFRLATTFAEAVPATAEPTLNPAPELAWVRALGGDIGSLPFNRLESIASVLTDRTGHLYLAGTWLDHAKFGSLEFAGYANGFLVQMDGDAVTHGWSQILSSVSDSESSDRITAAAIDGQGNLYITGIADTPPAFGLAAIQGDSFVAKFDPTGKPLWGASVANLCAGQPNALAVDAEGNVYLGGYCIAAGNPVQNQARTVTFGSVGLQGVTGWLAKLNSQGEFVWARNAGSDVFAAAVDPTGDVLITGSFSGPVVFGNEARTSGGSADAFVAKVGSDGAFAWVRTTEQQFNETGLAIASDAVGNVLVAIEMTGIGSFAGVPMPDPNDCLIAKLDPNGNLLWTTTTTAPFVGMAFSVMTDAENNVYIGGRLQAPQFGVLTVSNEFGGPFVVKLDSSGKPIWLFGPTEDSGGAVVTLNQAANGDVLFGGTFNGSLTFGAEKLLTPKAQDSQGFVGRLKTGIPVVAPMRIAIASLGDGFSLALTGPAGAAVELQSSADLNTWVHVSDAILKAIPTEIQILPESGPRFFRLRQR